MKLRPFEDRDSAVICGWIRDEKSLYQWSADRICAFPLPPDALCRLYRPVQNNPRFLPMTAEGDDGKVMGHLLIRYPNDQDDDMIRFGFVIIDPVLRGQGNGRRLLQKAIAYAKTVLHAKRITLGVFANNPAARACYESAGFHAYETSMQHLPIGDWECVELELAPETEQACSQGAE